MEDLPEGLSSAQLAAFRKLQRRFCDGLPERWKQIESAADAAERVAALHRLAGAAGSYGLTRLDERARHALHLVESGAQVSQVQVALAELKRALEDAADTM